MSEDGDPQGFYNAFMSAADGQGFVMFVFKDGVISGADPLGVKFDGTYIKSETGFFAKIIVSVPAHGEVIQGAKAGPEGMQYPVELVLEPNFWEKPFVEVSTPLGKVNARFERLRGI